MPQVPYPVTAESPEDLRQQVWELIRQVFEDRIGGLLIGDVFQDSGDVLTIMLASSGGLTKSSNRLTVIVTSTGGLQLTTTGLATKLKSGGGITSDANGLQVDTSTFIPLSIFDANTILKADSDNVPEALTVAEQRIVGRITGGEITSLTADQVKTLLALGATDSPTFNALTVTEGFGCNSKTPQTEVTVNGACTDLPSAVALVNQLRAALIANGVCV